MPDTYTSQFSGEEIDAALRAAQIISGADTPAALRKKLEIRGDTIPVSATDPTPVSEALTASGGGVNPNLLDNPLFQVWQRYSDGSYTGVPNKAYIADRWFILSSNGGEKNKITKVSPYGIKNESGPNCRFFQRLENAAQYNGMTLTLSVLKNDSHLFTSTLVASGWSDTTDIFGFFVNGGEGAIAWLNAGETILAAKLELGSAQTLAHKEGDKWVLNEIPDFGEQLRRCQRYFVRLTNTYGYGWTYNSSIANFFVSLPTTMRANPVIKLTTNGEIQTINGAKSVTGFEAKGIHPNGFAIDLHNSANALITGTPVTWHSSSMDISADL